MARSPEKEAELVSGRREAEGVHAPGGLLPFQSAVAGARDEKQRALYVRPGVRGPAPHPGARRRKQEERFRPRVGKADGLRRDGLRSLRRGDRGSCHGRSRKESGGVGAVRVASDAELRGVEFSGERRHALLDLGQGVDEEGEVARARLPGFRIGEVLRRRRVAVRGSEHHVAPRRPEPRERPRVAAASAVAVRIHDHRKLPCASRIRHGHLDVPLPRRIREPETRVRDDREPAAGELRRRRRRRGSGRRGCGRSLRRRRAGAGETQRDRENPTSHESLRKLTVGRSDQHIPGPSRSAATGCRSRLHQRET